ncbi:hypothetical protein AAHA92_15834 [Salvia divinorum]|uniref:Uncharacterized protein n=1 Tax=Salvia divinorum TaxID=28513 RepID=A0ABD1HJY9_SALDI
MVWIGSGREYEDINILSARYLPISGLEQFWQEEEQLSLISRKTALSSHFESLGRRQDVCFGPRSYHGE